MERLLTPLLHRFLRKFVKSSQEGVNETFKASLSGGGGITLHNLELHVDPLLPVSGIRARRAFARALLINIPWTSLNVQPIEVWSMCIWSVSSKERMGLVVIFWGLVSCVCGDGGGVAYQHPGGVRNLTTSMHCSAMEHYAGCI